MTYLYFSLRAINKDLNIDRAYKIILNRGLFNSWLVTTANGRKFCHQQRTYTFFKVEEAKNFIQHILNKRLKSSKRIGCNYELLELKGSENLLESLKYK